LEEALKNPPPVVKIGAVPETSPAESIKIKFRVESAGGGIGEVRVFHNGKLIKSDGHYRVAASAQAGGDIVASNDTRAILNELRGLARDGAAAIVQSPEKGRVYEGEVEIEPVRGDNLVSVTAFNASNTIQGPLRNASFQSTVPTRTPHLYILALGTDKYVESGINLKFAAKDAGDVSAKLAQQAGSLYLPENTHRRVLLDASKKQILEAIAELGRKIKIGDAFVLFAAGHGILKGNQYYLVTHDYNGQVSDYCLISSNEIVEMSKDIKALSQLFIFDTCHAGGLDYIVSGLYDARMSVLAKKIGLHIYAAASSRQAAIDGYKGNGLFSHVLLSGLDDNPLADQNQDKRVSVVELGRYSREQTGKLAQTVGHKQTPLIINFGRDNPIYNLRPGNVK
ncbi:MAG: caspase family protein, partial [Pseudomonadota bacterium]